MAIDKKWALNRLRKAQSNLVLSFAGIQLVKSEAIELLTEAVAKPSGEVVFHPEPADLPGAFSLPLRQLRASLDNGDLEHDVREFAKQARRSYLTACFETALAYAKASGQEAQLKSQPWFQFARVMRNSLSHDLHYNFNPGDMKVLPVTFEGITLDASLNGSEMLENHLTLYATLRLGLAMEAFVAAN